MRYILYLVTASALVFSAATDAGAGGSDKAKSGRQAKKANQFVAFEVTPRHEETARQFVKQYHPELATLLEPLKEKRLKAYHRAIRDLYRAQQRLDKIRTNDMVRYKLELQHWKIRSRIQLLSARIRVQDSPQLREQLRLSIEEQYDLRIAMLQHQRNRMTRSLERIDGQLKKLESDRSQQIERHFLQLTRGNKAKTRPGKPKKNATEKKKRTPN